MQSNYEINYMINSYVEKLANSGIVRSFYPDSITKTLNAPLTPVLEKLNILVIEDVLILKFEIRCCEGSHIVDIVSNYKDYLGKGVYCAFCDEEIDINIDNIFPIYYLKDEYREFVKKKSLTSHLKRETYQLKEPMVLA